MIYNKKSIIERIDLKPYNTRAKIEKLFKEKMLFTKIRECVDQHPQCVVYAFQLHLCNEAKIKKICPLSCHTCKLEL